MAATEGPLRLFRLPGYSPELNLDEMLLPLLGLAQANRSVSRRGVIRGIHFTEIPPGQAKYVVCASL